MNTREQSIIDGVVGDFALMLARIYQQWIHPRKYDRIFYPNGLRVRVTIEQHKTADDTQPLRPAQDEDDRISD
jgi:hypothetical protein